MPDLISKKVQLFDGAMGTILTAYPEVNSFLPEELNLLFPEKILAIHRAYVEAGAQYITTNSFSANPIKLNSSRFSLQEVLDAAIELARWAAGESSCKVMLNIGPTGKLLEPLGELGFEETYENYKTVVEYTKDKVDGYVLETFSDLYEIRAAILAVKENSTLPLMATMTFDTSGRTLTGSSPEIVALTLSALGVDVPGINCSTSPEHLIPLVKRMRAFTHLPLLVQPNKGFPILCQGSVSYAMSDEDFVYYTGKLIEAGASIVGGCCGTTPATIGLMAKYKSLPLKEYAPVAGHYICSSTRLLKLQQGLVCGERLNPTGKKKLQQALLNSDFGYLQQEALSQQEAGAHFLDLNVGIPNADEVDLLCRATKKIQEVCDLPLQLDSSNSAAIGAALRVYNGVPVINSINGSGPVLKALLPLLAKYGASAVALTLDEQGIPETVEGRLRIAKRIIARAAAKGINKNRLIFDALVMAVSSNQHYGQLTLDTLRSLKKMGVLTTIGLSNVSFGLPNRPLLNRSFLLMALTSGLDIPILNPLDEENMQSLKAFNALSGADPACENYISYHSPSQVHEQSDSLYQVVLSGLKESLPLAMDKILKEKEPQQIIDEDLIPALNEVGQRFEKKHVFLPQLIRSAEVARQAFQQLGELYVQKTDKTQGLVVLATVKGDIHDIGKNIVKVVLESHGYRVLDLGKNVDTEKVLEAYRTHRPLAIGLSALMTTTVPSMSQTVEALKEMSAECPVIVGGAVITESLAREMGADYYAADALTAIRILEEL
ncbi:MAG TPA: homocysteine S-methyltransferase family protein [Bacteroidales bacterium]|nr:homocysteine S-methyltransferase family protein [Bacteroidales bacterium]